MTAKLHLGHVEPYAGLLRLPAPGQRLYKIMKAERLIEAIAGKYLHFNRVDRYGDFPGADPHDGTQLPADLAANLHGLCSTTSIQGTCCVDQLNSLEFHLRVERP
jgi:hypothetical protein